VYYVRRTKPNLKSESVTENITMLWLCLHLRFGMCKYIDVMNLLLMIHTSTFSVCINYLDRYLVVLQ
jgi:hypothetical protein